MNKKSMPAVVKIPLHDHIALPAASEKLNSDLGVALKKRRSRREFFKQKISKNNLSDVFHYAIGNNGFEFAGDFGVIHKRNFPSPGARHSLDFYLIIESSLDIDLGVFRMDYCTTKLSVIRDAVSIAESGFKIESSGFSAPALLVITSTSERLSFKYPGSLPRFSLLEAGHAAQNILLVCESLGMAACPCGRWSNQSLSELLKIDSEAENIVYLLAIG